MKYSPVLFWICLLGFSCQSPKVEEKDSGVLPDLYDQDFRPQIHFSPIYGWMNDPNGMVYYEGEYHLFYQHYPDSTIWGPMHWGHAVSTDLVSWEHLPIALYPDELGYIFSGSAVMDLDNTSGLGTKDNPAMVAVYTYHDPVGAEAGNRDFQTQGIAYSLDKGRSWEVYPENPVLDNPGIRDFRDPKVIWHEESNRWVMALAVDRVIHFYSSPNLLDWKPESEFGENIGNKGGVWECPDLFPLRDESGTEKWILLVSINPGAPNGGSGTQYFVGEFDGSQFIPDDGVEKWLDYGTDNYAGVTWSNIPEQDGRRLFIGWMSNWDYANETPTHPWRSAMTLPRTLSLHKESSGYYVYSREVSELELIEGESITLGNLNSGQSIQIPFNSGHYAMDLKGVALQPEEQLEIGFANEDGEQLILKVLNDSQEVHLDRSQSGKVDFSKVFTGLQILPLRGPLEQLELKIVVDWSSVEIFISEDRYVMTAQIFPVKTYDRLNIQSSLANDTGNLTFTELHRIW